MILQECDSSEKHEVQSQKLNKNCEKTESQNTPTKSDNMPHKRKRTFSGSDRNGENIETQNAQCSKEKSPQYKRACQQNNKTNHKEASTAENNRESKNYQNTHENERESIPTFKAMIGVLQFKNVKFLLLIKLIIAFPFSLLYSMFSMAIMDYYQLGPRINGLILGYIGILTILFQGQGYVSRVQ